MCANAGVSGTIKPFHDLILAWQPSLASRPSCLCKSPYRPAASKYEKCFTSPSGQAASCFADYFGNACPARRSRVSSVGLRDTVPKASHRFMSHSKSFAPALHPYSFLSRQAGLLQSVKHLQNTEVLRPFLTQQLHMQRSHSSPAGNVQGNPKAQVSSAASWQGQFCFFEIHSIYFDFMVWFGWSCGEI